MTGRAPSLRHVGRVAIVLTLVAVAAGGCDVAGLVPVGPQITDEMVSQLDGQGLAIRPAVVRSDEIAPDEAMAVAREQFEREPSNAVYAEVFCVSRRERGCVSWPGFFGEPDETAGVWIMTFPGIAGEYGPAWAMVDASTGEVVLGDWPLPPE